MSNPSVEYFYLPADISSWHLYSNDRFKEYRVFILTDTHTRTHCLYKYLESGGPQPHAVFSLQPGEPNKNLKAVEDICSELTNHGFTIQTLLVALGGGMVGDVGGFASGVYMRGIPYIQVPTSLLAMVDASTGGKTGVNFQHLKNRIGLFYPPVAVLIEPRFLTTLSRDEFESGKTEMVKHRLLKCRYDYQELLDAPPSDIRWREWIKESIAIKKEITDADYSETGMRKLLNLGHTLGHAFETLLLRLQKPVTHGQTVAWGLAGEALIAHENDLITDHHLDQIMHLLHYYPLPQLTPREAEKLPALCMHDKKNTNSEMLFALPHSERGGVYDVKVPRQQLFKVIQTLFK